LKPSPWPDAAIPLLAEGADWLVLHKPAGVATHPLDATQRRTALNAAIARRPELAGVGEGGLRSGVVHRLDVATSGTLLFASTQARWTRLRAAFAQHRVAKRYVALVHGRPSPWPCPLTLRLAVRQHRPARVAVVADDRPGRDCSLSITRIETRDGRSRLEIDLHTGFLHQVRVTLAHLGCPVVGDRVYGRPDAADRLMLHADRLAFDDVLAECPAPFGLD
jgi:23S rRNA pseudouridine1911/1915/1917 synthase